MADFAEFGKVKPVNRGFSLFGLIKWLFLAGLCFGLPWAAVGWRDFYRSFAEGAPPTIRAVKSPSGLGLDSADLSISIKDELAGLDQVIVRAEQQNSDTRELLRKDYKKKTAEDNITLPLNAKELGLREGTLRIIVLAFDSSLWSNRASISIELKVDYQKPKIEVLTSQHNAVRGGVELVFYSVSGGSDFFSGVMAGPYIFPGFPAAKLDPEFSKTPEVYFSFFSVPLDSAAEERLEILARNAVGNSSIASFFYRVKELNTPTVSLEVNREFLQNSVDPLYHSYLKLRAVHRGQKNAEYTPASDKTELSKRLAVINREFRPLLAEDLRVLFGRPKLEKLWAGPFLRPAGKALPYPFGALKTYSFAGENVGSMRQDGLDFATAEGTSVRAANSGSVIFSGELGVYGKTIIIDHGFGLTTLYQHLSSLSTQEGAHLESGQAIGLSGSTGYALKPEIGYEVRLHGLPVRPEEWWDRVWIRDHLEDKIDQIKNKLGLEIKKALE